MTVRTEGIVYLVGVVVLGLIYYPLKQSVSDSAFVAIAIGYLVVLRIVGRLIAGRNSTKSSTGSGDA
jgi:hypothetical protein